MSEKHSRLSPSKAHRYVRCPVSVLREEGFPPDTSPYAEEGRLAHELAAARLTGAPDPMHVPLDMFEPVMTYVETVRAMSRGASVTRVETRVRLDAVLDEGESGTVDFFAVLGKELQVHDLKYGKGVPVEADGNEQLILYGLGALPIAEMLGEIESVRLVIHMPRRDGGFVSEKVYTVAEMYGMVEKFRSVVEIIQGLSKDDPANPGAKQCRFCNKHLKAVCPELKAVPAAAVADFDDVDSVAGGVAAYGMEKLAESYALLDLAAVWAKAVADEAMTRMLNGEAMPGYKLVAGRPGNRTWTDDAAAEARLKAMRLKGGGLRPTRYSRRRGLRTKSA